MKLKRKNGLTVGIITLSAVALTSVGFAAWVISAGDTAEVTGNIEVDTVTDDGHVIVGVYSDGILELTDNQKAASVKGTTDLTQPIKFGAPVNTTDDSSVLASNWLSTDNAADYEKLSAKFYVCVLNGDTSASNFTVENYIKAGIKVVEASSPVAGDDELSGKSGFAGAMDLRLVTLPSITVAKDTTNASTLDGNINFPSEYVVDATPKAHSWFVVDIQFGWGAAFNKQNPYDFYNAKLSSASIDDPVLGTVSAATHARKYLTALNKMLGGVKYKLTFKTYANSTERGLDTEFATSKTNLLVVNTKVAVTGVSLNKNSTSLTVGGTETLAATIAPTAPTSPTITDVIWTSSKTAIATVNSSGVVTAVAAGTTIITVTTIDGNYTASCTVTVNAAS